MPGRTLSSLRDEVISDSFDTTKYTPLVNLWLNEGQGRVARRMNLPEREFSDTVAVTAGDATYTLPSDLILLTAIVDEFGELTPVGRDKLPVSTATGRPTMYALYGSELILSPVPVADATLTRRYRATVPLLVNDADVTLIPYDFNHLLVTYALYKAYRKEDDPQMAQFYWGEFERDLRDMRASVQRRDSSRSSQIRGMWVGGGSPRFHRP